MSVLTEEDIRKLMAKHQLAERGELIILKDQIVTPSARAYLHEKNITLKIEDSSVNKRIDTRIPHGDDGIGSIQTMKDKQQGVTTYETLFGGKLTEKPEHMTHLRGNLLVFKDNKRIALRGAIDSLESEIILVQTVALKENRVKLSEDLEEIIRFIRMLLRCEVSGEAVGDFKLLSLNEKEIRERSYHPSKYYNRGHFLPTCKHGEIMAYLNRLRTRTREAEIIAYQAFKNEYGQVEREDIVRAFNRLSSLFWIMMFLFLDGSYNS